MSKSHYKYKGKRGKTSLNILADKMRYLYRMYKLDLADWISLYQEQNYSCAICGIKQSDLDYDLVIDHDHITGDTRGLLCHKCNTGLGLFQDSTDNLDKAINYLNETPLKKIRSKGFNRKKLKNNFRD